MEKIKFSTSPMLPRCPHCSVARPTLKMASNVPIERSDGGRPFHWAVFGCTTCGSGILAKVWSDGVGSTSIIKLFPEPPSVHDDIPEPARRFLQQAHDTLHAPDAAAVMAGSAVDAMLKQLKFVEGSVYQRIEQAVAANVLTKGMGEWAHTVRLGSNRPRHADGEKPHVTPEEAAQSVEFATALGQFLFVLTARIERGIQEAKEAEESTKN